MLSAGTSAVSLEAGKGCEILTVTWSRCADRCRAWRNSPLTKSLLDFSPVLPTTIHWKIRYDPISTHFYTQNQSRGNVFYKQQHRRGIGHTSRSSPSILNLHFLFSVTNQIKKMHCCRWKSMCIYSIGQMKVELTFLTTPSTFSSFWPLQALFKDCCTQVTVFSNKQSRTEAVMTTR